MRMYDELMEEFVSHLSRRYSIGKYGVCAIFWEYCVGRLLP